MVEPLRPSRGGRIFVRLVGDDDDALYVFGGDLARDHFDGEAALKALAAGHRHRVVEKNLVGDVDAGGDGEAEREDAGMIVGAVAEVLKHMRPFRERRLADPVRPFAAHLGKALGGTVHPLDHVMAADPGIGTHAIGHFCRRVMRAAGTEIRGAGGNLPGHGERGLRAFELAHPLFEILATSEPQQAAADRDRDVICVERAGDRKQPVPVFVLLADADRLTRRAVKLLAQLDFDQRSFFLDDDNQFEPARELAKAQGLDRPCAGEFHEPQTEPVRRDLVDPEVVHRLTHVEIGFSRRDHADFRVGAAGRDDFVQAIGSVARRAWRRA